MMRGNEMEKDVISDGLAETDLADSCEFGLNDAGTCGKIDTPLTQPSSRAVPSVYFIRVGDAIKIGSAANFKKRIQTHQVSHATPLIVLAVVPATIADEYQTHQRF